MTLEEHLEFLGLPTEYKFKVVDALPVMVDYVNEQFLVFNEEDYNRLKTTFRMIGESISMTGNTAPPYMIFPEQVAVLCQYGHVRVRKFKNGIDCFDETAFHPTDRKPHFISDVEKARKVAIGRKAKEMKRKLNGDSLKHRKALKVTKKELQEIQVTDEEVQKVMVEFSSEHNDEETDFINLPLNYNKEDFYDYIDFFSLPFPNTKEFRRKELVLHDLWRRGFYLTTGLRFGCHYLAYEGIPGEKHARFLVNCIDVEETLSPLKMIALTRVATQVKKTVLLACVADDSHIPHYMTLSWFKPYES